jgi:hypothetical protein
LEGASTTDGKESSLLRYQIARNNLQGLQAQPGQINFNTVVQKLLDPVWIEGFTKWNIVYEPRALKTSFRTQSFRDRFYEFDLTPFIPNGHCQQTPRLYFDFANLEKLSPTKQNINELFTPLTSEIEKDLIKEGLVKVVLPTLTKVLGKKSKQVANEMLTTFTDASFGTNGVKCVSTVD